MSCNVGATLYRICVFYFSLYFWSILNPYISVSYSTKVQQCPPPLSLSLLRWQNANADGRISLRSFLFLPFRREGRNFRGCYAWDRDSAGDTKRGFLSAFSCYTNRNGDRERRPATHVMITSFEQCPALFSPLLYSFLFPSFS